MIFVRFEFEGSLSYYSALNYYMTMNNFDLNTILQRLKSLANPDAIDAMARFGVIAKNAYGIDTPVMIIIKFVIFSVSFGFIFAGYIFRRLRKKNNLLMSAYKTIDQLKKSIDEYTARWSGKGETVWIADSTDYADDTDITSVKTT